MQKGTLLHSQQAVLFFPTAHLTACATEPPSRRWWSGAEWSEQFLWIRTRRRHRCHCPIACRRFRVASDCPRTKKSPENNSGQSPDDARAPRYNPEVHPGSTRSSRVYGFKNLKPTAATHEQLIIAAAFTPWFVLIVSRPSQSRHGHWQRIDLLCNRC